MSLDDPLYREMQEIVWSARRASGTRRGKNGEPALAVVDPILQEAMGTDTTHGAGTMNAGSLVAEVMRHAGYEKCGEALARNLHRQDCAQCGSRNRLCAEPARCSPHRGT